MNTSLSDSDVQVFRQQIFNDEAPGSLLKDFAVILDYIGDGVPVSAISRLLPINDLPTINDKLTYPLQLKLKRPQQKSYPHINGLFLLLRASGLTRLVGANKKMLLVFDEEVLASWKSLNATERYFSLMEAWLNRGNPEILGERAISWDFCYSFRGIELFLERLKNGVDVVKVTPHLFDSLKYRPGLHNLALMQLFGWLTITTDHSIEQNWPIDTITFTDWGRSLSRYYHDQLENYLQQEAGEGASLNDGLAQYFPGFKQSLAQLQDEPLSDKTINFAVLGGQYNYQAPLHLMSWLLRY
jgi:hypothetical protein